MVGLIKGDTRSLDYSSYVAIEGILENCGRDGRAV